MAAKTGMLSEARMEALTRFFKLTGEIPKLILEGYRTRGQTEQLLNSLDAALHMATFALQEFREASRPNKIPAPAITTRPANQSISGVLTWTVRQIPGISEEAIDFLAIHNLRTIQGLVFVRRATFQRLHGYNRRIGSNIERGLAALGLRFDLITDMPGKTTEAQRFLNQLIPQPTTETLGLSIDELELGVEAANQLNAAKIKTLRQLVAKTEIQLCRNGLTTGPIVQIKERLSELGLWVGMTPEEIAALPAAALPAPPAE